MAVKIGMLAAASVANFYQRQGCKNLSGYELTRRLLHPGKRARRSSPASGLRRRADRPRKSFSQGDIDLVILSLRPTRPT